MELSVRTKAGVPVLLLLISTVLEIGYSQISSAIGINSAYILYVSGALVALGLYAYIKFFVFPVPKQ
jgi:hypothetical protein